MYMKEYMHTNVVTVSSDTLVHDAEKIMRDHRIRRLPVVDKGKLVGVVTKDKIREATGHHATTLSIWELNYILSKMKVKDVMERDILTVTPDTTLEEAVTLAHERGVGTLPVVDKDNPKTLLGIATTTDLYKITADILGFGEPGVRIHLFECSKAGRPLGEVMDIIDKHKVVILSMFHVIPPGLGRQDCILHLDTEDASQIIKELKQKGYDVEERPR